MPQSPSHDSSGADKGPITLETCVFGKLIQWPDGPIVSGVEHAITLRTKGFPEAISRLIRPDRLLKTDASPARLVDPDVQENGGAVLVLPFVEHESRLWCMAARLWPYPENGKGQSGRHATFISVVAMSDDDWTRAASWLIPRLDDHAILPREPVVVSSPEERFNREGQKVVPEPRPGTAAELDEAVWLMLEKASQDRQTEFARRFDRARFLERMADFYALVPPPLRKLVTFSTGLRSASIGLLVSHGEREQATADDGAQARGKPPALEGLMDQTLAALEGHTDWGGETKRLDYPFQGSTQLVSAHDCSASLQRSLRAIWHPRPKPRQPIDTDEVVTPDLAPAQTGESVSRRSRSADMSSVRTALMPSRRERDRNQRRPAVPQPEFPADGPGRGAPRDEFGMRRTPPQPSGAPPASAAGAPVSTWPEASQPQPAEGGAPQPQPPPEQPPAAPAPASVFPEVRADAPPPRTRLPTAYGMELRSDGETRRALEEIAKTLVWGMSAPAPDLTALDDNLAQLASIPLPEVIRFRLATVAPPEAQRYLRNSPAQKKSDHRYDVLQVLRVCQEARLRTVDDAFIDQAVLDLSPLSASGLYGMCHALELRSQLQGGDPHREPLHSLLLDEVRFVCVKIAKRLTRFILNDEEYVALRRGLLAEALKQDTTSSDWIKCERRTCELITIDPAFLKGGYGDLNDLQNFSLSLRQRPAGAVEIAWALIDRCKTAVPHFRRGGVEAIGKLIASRIPNEVGKIVGGIAALTDQISAGLADSNETNNAIHLLNLLDQSLAP